MPSATLSYPLGFCQCGCGRKTTIPTFTNRQKGSVKGIPVRYIHNHHNIGKRKSYQTEETKYVLSNGYIQVRLPYSPQTNKHGRFREHILIAERVLGKRLPSGAVVHHINGIKSDNRNSNLVICENGSYHQILHARIRALKECGNPQLRKCVLCKIYGNPNLMKKSRQRFVHRLCKTRDRNKRARKAALKAKTQTLLQ